ncbi:MAG: response regulator transcription factor [Sphingobacteriales bacterium]|nr:MAG: response regulator transcription factor [Sphingobacteriales bacterium]
MEYKNALILDDHHLFAEAFSMLLKDIKRFENIQCIHSISELDSLLKTKSISHLFMDFNMPGINTLSEIKRVKALYPALYITMVSCVSNGSIIHQMKKNGASSFISKNSSSEQIQECLQTLSLGKSYVSPDVRNAILDVLMNGQDQLFTAREYEVLQHIGTGATIEAMAAVMNLSKHTIVAHRRNMMEKLEVNSVAALLKKAMDLNMI